VARRFPETGPALFTFFRSRSFLPICCKGPEVALAGSSEECSTAGSIVRKRCLGPSEIALVLELRAFPLRNDLIASGRFFWVIASVHEERAVEVVDGFLCFLPAIETLIPQSNECAFRTAQRTHEVSVGVFCQNRVEYGNVCTMVEGSSSTKLK
jgi:hypothetical protein